MTMHHYGSPTTGAGGSRGQYWNTNSQASGSATNTAHSTHVGTLASGASGTSPLAPIPTIEEAGIRAGEIIGYRAWFLRPNGLLTSMYVSWYHWEPRKTEDIAERQGCGMFHVPVLSPHGGNGFHAFKRMEDAEREYSIRHRYDGCEAVIFGTVALWGEVIEHEMGYRAQFAAIRSLDSITNGFINPFRIFKLRAYDRKLKAAQRLYEVNQ